MSGSSDAAPNDTPAQQLRIGHLFLITAGSAVAIWLQQTPGAARDARLVAVAAVFAPVYGTALIALPLVVVHLSGRQWFLSEPGHWLLVLVGLPFFGITALIRSAQFLDPTPDVGDWRGILGVAILSVGILCTGWSLFLPLMAMPDVTDPAWRRVFWLLGSVYCFPMLFCCTAPLLGRPFGLAVAVAAIPLTFVIGLLTTVGLAVRDDRRRQRRRGAWHWLGIAVLVGSLVHLGVLLGVYLSK